MITKKSIKLYKIENDIDIYYELENGWWYYCSIHRNIGYKMKHTNEIHYNDRKSQPRLCPTCNYVWSREYDSTTKTIASILLPDFPKYKLRKYICYFCKPINNT